MKNEEKNNKVEKAVELIKKYLDVKVTGYEMWQDLGITEASISNYRNGKTKPMPKYAEIIIDYFESGKYLKENNQNTTKKNDKAIGITSKKKEKNSNPDITEILLDYKKLSDENRRLRDEIDRLNKEIKNLKKSSDQQLNGTENARTA